MNRDEWENYRPDFIVQTLVKQELFGQWLTHFFFLNKELRHKYDEIYQGMFYIKIYEVLNEGFSYIEKVLIAVKGGSNPIEEKWCERFLEGVDNIKKLLSEKKWITSNTEDILLVIFFKILMRLFNKT